MKLYTQTGDAGETGLFGGGRVSKADLRVDAYGTVDEANAHLGMARALSDDPDVIEVLRRLQEDLLKLGADLATPVREPRSDGSTRKDGTGKGAAGRIDRMSAVDVERLEREIDRLEEALPPLKQFVLPGGSGVAASLHLARTVVRRAERACVGLQSSRHDANSEAIRYLNRLSDLCFVLARTANRRGGKGEILWQG